MRSYIWVEMSWFLACCGVLFSTLDVEARAVRLSKSSGEAWRIRNVSRPSVLHEKSPNFGIQPHNQKALNPYTGPPGWLLLPEILAVSARPRPSP
ncbi:hypothetical protein B0T21DRAFT_359870 [Apiosordaria backusii]|uniref:Secreted protein n=1 Tax=Apiosordaria backusii TaxID=314023 RepID=A0AA40K118_9PEZI|nr:hypothetical protein B0T21DRAFT_359870 [Apiosordaria backusii]